MVSPSQANPFRAITTSHGYVVMVLPNLASTMDYLYKSERRSSAGELCKSDIWKVYNTTVPFSRVRSGEKPPTTEDEEVCQPQPDQSLRLAFSRGEVLLVMRRWSPTARELSPILPARSSCSPKQCTLASLLLYLFQAHTHASTHVRTLPTFTALDSDSCPCCERWFN